MGKGEGKVHPRTGHKGPEKEYMYSFTLSLTSALDVGRWSSPCRSHLTPRKDPTCCIGGWVSPRASLDWCRKSGPHRNSIPRPSVRSKLLYRLCYPCPHLKWFFFTIGIHLWRIVETNCGTFI